MAIADIAEVRSVIKRLLTIAVMMSLAGFSLHCSRLQYEERAETSAETLLSLLNDPSLP